MNEAQVFALLDQALPGRTFRVLAPQGKKEPYLIFALIDAIPSNTMRGNAKLWQMNFRVDSYARTLSDALAIMERVFALVDACGGDPLIENRQDLYEQDTRIHRVSVVLSTWYELDEVQS